MDRRTFEENMVVATLLGKTSNNAYWRGYQRGLRRLYHGNNFGTDEEHAVWITSVEECGNGYRAGYAGISAKMLAMQNDVLNPEGRQA
ncbi:hypothetical protein KBG31_03300 [Patescibacteria group bacterium]|nr:hypothetical protein [Patescibacteria group bacterium]